MSRIGGVEDPEARAGRMARELRKWDRRVDIGATADRLQPDFMRAARIGSDKRELFRGAGVGDVVEPEAAIGVRPRAVLEADSCKLAREARCRRVLHDRLFRPSPRTERFDAPSANVETCRGRLGLLRS
jgi:hypothetical protein